MFDIGWSELLLIGVIAILVVGPKDLPRMMRVVGQYAGKIRAMAREFQRSFDDMAREAELEELRKEVQDIRKANPVNKLKDSFKDPVDAVNKAIMEGVPPEEAHKIAAEAEGDKDRVSVSEKSEPEKTAEAPAAETPVYEGHEGPKPETEPVPQEKPERKAGPLDGKSDL
ncbi:twin-arginine translocation protein TatB [Tepidicaulis marinus]|uniref:Sec-independent protein translocase protein TatB n=1 Tax=Tepidicaulis marinus TaxID=1333998 RepID=A0A081B7H5_9HYPH|nr:Sec-independent protein translocase protein TatB [Tepidicaulis marinus]GAK43993.1 twin-arginine translocation protein TatB [Tepidicaulis marinus]